MFLKGQSGDEEVEVTVGMVAPVRPSADSQRTGFALFDQWDLGETFAQRGCLMRSSRDSCVGGGDEGGTRGNHGRCFQKERSNN